MCSQNSAAINLSEFLYNFYLATPAWTLSMPHGARAKVRVLCRYCSDHAGAGQLSSPIMDDDNLARRVAGKD